MTFDDAFVPKLAKKARLRLDRHSGKHMILYPERGLELNDTGAAIASRLDGSRTIRTIVEELTAEHEGASQEDVRRDVSAFIASLRDRGLLEVDARGERNESNERSGR